jgi:hypothetical protein
MASHLIKFNNRLALKKISVVVATVILPSLLGACSSNNGGSEAAASDTTGTTPASTLVVSPSTTGTGTTDTGTTGTGTTGTGTTGTGTTGTGTTGTGTTGTGTTGTGTTGTGTTGTGTTGTGTTGTGTTGTGTTGTGTTAASFPSYFTKLGDDGSTLPADADVWSCLLDTRTGLIWEVKTDDGGLRDKDWRYRYNGSAGLSPAGTDYPCVGVSACNPMSYIEALNAYGVCGKRDWHLPTASDMAGIAEPHNAPPHINLAAFAVNTDLPYCIAKVEPGHYQGMHFGLELPAGANVQDALRVDMQDYDFECRALMLSY